MAYAKRSDRINAWNRWYSKPKNRARHIRNSKRNEIRRRANCQSWIYRYKAKKGCRDCGIKNPVVLDLHHVRGVKLFAIGEHHRLGFSLEKIKVEAKKCIVLCANCHRIRHAKKFGGLV